MIEEEIFREIQEEKCVDEPYFGKEKCDEPILFDKKEWDSLRHWAPVSNIPVEEIYKDLPEVKQFHDSYCKMWGLRTTKGGR